MSLTKQDLKDVTGAVAKQLEPVEKRLTESIAGINRNFNRSQEAQNKVLASIDVHRQTVETDVQRITHAVVDLLGTERYVRNLVKEFKAQGIS